MFLGVGFPNNHTRHLKGFFYFTEGGLFMLNDSVFLHCMLFFYAITDSYR